ncbi:MAG: SDH family Clp fold serine proteinase [Janthinobacterium lividum]
MEPTAEPDNEPDNEPDYDSLFRPFITENDTDLYIFSAPIDHGNADFFIDLVRTHPNKRPTCTLILTTLGGSPDDGYRMARAIQKYYEKFVLLLFGMCKSTGTLIALGADEIAMGDFAELGPLDIQLMEDNSQTSGLSYTQSLFSLHDILIQHFYSNFTRLSGAVGTGFPSRVTAEIASTLALGLLAPISSQLDPVKLGEVKRAVDIAEEYGRRLCHPRPMPSELIAGYRSHSFVIDLLEAQDIFGEEIVRPLTDLEHNLERMLMPDVRHEKKTLVIDLIKKYVPDLMAPRQEQESPEPDVAPEDDIESNPPLNISQDGSSN